MGALLDIGAWNLPLCARRWQRARPFAHLVLPGAIDEDGCEALCAALDEEPADRIVSEVYEVMASGERFTASPLPELAAELGSAAMLDAVAAISGKTVERVKVRAYAYGPGHYLLPHADRDADALRRVAFVLYLHASEDLVGGEFELYECRVELGQIVVTEPVGRIAPRAGTLLLFDVNELSLHRVREVERGLRVSLAGWFY
jgi:Rps23 Pro-64 3,4-dihydroxylase Tpa1-like proline 4-hydroxylase